MNGAVVRNRGEALIKAKRAKRKKLRATGHHNQKDTSNFTTHVVGTTQGKVMRGAKLSNQKKGLENPKRPIPEGGGTKIKRR